MKLLDVEKFAIEKLFPSTSRFDSEVRNGISSAEVIERKSTGVGFFSTIRFVEMLPDSGGQLQWDWNFEHKQLTHGGSFMASLESKNTIEIEAVVHSGSWPEEFSPELFCEAGVGS